MAEVEGAAARLRQPAARLSRAAARAAAARGCRSAAGVQDVGRRCLPSRRRPSDKSIPLDTRPVLFALARAFAEACPGTCRGRIPVARAFGATHADESHRARLRVEIGRLRKALRDVADIEATKDGFALVPRRARDVAVLAPPTDEAHATVLALLADGEAWSTLRAGAGARRQSAHRAAGPRRPHGRRQSAAGRPRPGAALDGAAAAGFPDNLVTPGRAARRLE